mgnify:CR=1 FL=1
MFCIVPVFGYIFVSQNNEMKTLFTLILATCISFSASAGGEAKKIHQKYSSKDGVVSMSLSKEIMDAFDVDFDWKETMKNFKGDFSSVQVLIVDNNNEIKNSSDDILKQLKLMGYKLIDMEDSDEDVVVFTDKKKKKFNEIHMLSRGKEGAVLISIYGSFVISNKANLQ